MKYVILDYQGLETPMLFPCFWNHADIANAISGYGTPVAAGFLKMDDLGNLYVTGESISLKVKSRPEDLELIIKNIKFEM